MANNIGVGSNTTANGLSGADSIFGTDDPSLNDIIYGHMGNDTIGIGNGIGGTFDLSTIYGGQGDDSITVATFDKVYGNLGNDSISVGSSSTVYGGQGDDAILSYGTNAVIYGNLGDDGILLGGSTAYGGQGNDLIEAFGNSLVHGNLGDDTLFDNVGDSTLFGDGGRDSLVSVDNDVVYGNIGDDTLDTIYNSTLYGGQGDDLAFVGGNNSILYGNLGDDILVDSSAAANGSTMFGGQGNDSIISEDANNDVMNGGLGSDLFIDSYGATGATHTTTVSDFVTGTDQLSFGSGAGSGGTTPAPSGNSTNFVASQNNTVTNEASAATYAATVEAAQPNATQIAYVFVAGANDGFLFYDGTGGGTGTFNAEITLTGHNSLTSLSANDITGSTLDKSV